MQSGPELGWERNFYFPLVHQSSEAPPLKEGMTLTKCFSLFEGHSQRGVSWELFVARGWFHPGRGIWWHTCHLLSLLCFLPPADRTGHCSFWNNPFEFTASLGFWIAPLSCFFFLSPPPWVLILYPNFTEMSLDLLSSAEANDFSCL